MLANFFIVSIITLFLLGSFCIIMSLFENENSNQNFNLNSTKTDDPTANFFDEAEDDDFEINDSVVEIEDEHA